MTKKIKLGDLIVIDPGFRDNMRDSAHKMLELSDKPELRVKIDATHSGKLINRRVYPGIKVQKGYTSFFSKENGGSADYNKPVLAHHDEFKDAVGRVVNANFTQLKQGDLFISDYSKPEKEGEGSGVITVEALITDPKAIEKIIDGRYLSVSSGHSTDQMFCSICGGSIMSCEHYPGFWYDEDGEEVDITDEVSISARECFGITNDMTYHELSFVNVPADPTAQIRSFDADHNWKPKGSILKELEDKVQFSFTQGGKDSLRAFSLIDNDRELSLLDEKPLTQTSVNIPPLIASKLKAILEDEAPEPSNDQEPKNQDKPTQQQDNNKETSQNKEGIQTMEDNKVDLNEFNTVKTERDNLKDNVASLTDEKTTLESQLKDSADELQAVKDQLASVQGELRQHLADTLASYRIRLGKPGTEGLDSDEDRQKYVDELAKRGIESLKDALTDITPEMESFEEKDTTAADIVADGKLDSNVGAKGHDVRGEDQKDTSSAIDALFDN